LTVWSINSKGTEMKPIMTPITGTNLDIKPEAVDAKVFEALHQFYKAFNNRDFELMQQNWLNSEEIAMDNPLGGIKRGWDELKTIYQRIFSGEAEVYVEYYDYTIVEFDGGFCAVGRERGYVKTKGEKLELAIRTSRVYKEVEGSYRQIHHHGSIEDPKLLEAYQSLVK
jgi:hypothetical protein